MSLNIFCHARLYGRKILRRSNTSDSEEMDGFCQLYGIGHDMGIQKHGERFVLLELCHVHPRCITILAPHNCDNEDILRNITQLSANELEIAISLIDIVNSLRLQSKLLSRDSVVIFVQGRELNSQSSD